VLVVLMAGGIAAAAAAPLVAQQPSPEPSVWELPQTAPQQGEFVPVKGLPQQEQLPAASLVMGAYAFVWVVLLLYVWSLWRRLGALQRELSDLRKRTAARK